MNKLVSNPDPGLQEETMSLLQRIDPHPKTYDWHPAFTPSGLGTDDVSVGIETEEDVLIRKARDVRHSIPDEVLERAPPAWEVLTEYVVTSFVVAVIAVTIALAIANVLFPDGTVIVLNG
jgi:hypothetical protein